MDTRGGGTEPGLWLPSNGPRCRLPTFGSAGRKTEAVGILTTDMKRVVRDVRLGFHATVNDDGSPNLSPKGTTAVWDDDHLFFADIRSPQTVANIRRGSHVEVNVVDPFVRKGYRFNGPAVVHERGTEGYAAGIDRLRAEGFDTAEDRIQSVVVIEVHRALPLISPAYDDGARTERDIIQSWQQRFARLHETANTESER